MKWSVLSPSPGGSVHEDGQGGSRAGWRVEKRRALSGEREAVIHFQTAFGGTSCMQVSSTEDVNTKFSCSHCEFPSLAVLQWAEDTGWLCPFLSLALTIFLFLPSDGPLALGKECDTGVPALAEHSRHPFSTLCLGSGLLPRV